ncbi:MAG: hypothetical protein GY730_07290 [bacterium]|nr:hypothetical protein [bacterium]
MIQMLLPIFQSETTRINDYLAFFKKNSRIYYFNGSMPIFSHAESDLASFRMFTSQLYVNGNCKQIDIVKAFGVSSISVKRSVKKYQESGAAAFFKKDKIPRKPRVLTKEVLSQAQKMLNNGQSRSTISKALGIKSDTLYRATKSGQLVDAQEINKQNGSTKSDRSIEDSKAEIGMGCTRVIERIAASVGELDEAPTRFEKSYDVPNAGVLCTLPALLSNGLLNYTSEYFNLPKGFYSIVQVFLLLAFMTLSRVKNVEQLKLYPPGEWGNILGIDRIPEVRTLRNKIKYIAETGGTSEWSAALSKEWMESDPEAAGVLYIDGSVRVYNGYQTKLPRRYVARQKLCLRGMTDYWVNDQNSRPFFVITTPFTSGLSATLENDIIPRLEKDIPDQPNEDELKADQYIKRFVIIFDREGYSPAFFKKMWKKRIACQTYHKYPQKEWSELEFHEYTVELSFGKQVKMKLAERGICLSNLWIREIRKLTVTGHQVSVLSTDYKSDLTLIAGHMFSRWSQENFFKYMRKHFNIQRVIDYQTESADETKKVVNPAYRKLESQVKSKTSKLNRKKVEFYDTSINESSSTEKNEIAKYERQRGEIQEQTELLQIDIEQLKAKRKKTSKHIPVEELPEEEHFKQLSSVRKQFMDTIKMIAYRSETAMAILLRTILKKTDDVRTLLQNIFTSEADLIPNEKEKTLTIRLHNYANPLFDNAVRKLCEHLNETETIYPSTDMQIIYVLVSKLNPRDQEF